MDDYMFKTSASSAGEEFSALFAERPAKLVYTTGKGPGILRKKTGRGFQYYFQGKKIADDSTLGRIRRLAIPPAWTRVWIAPNENAHLQAIGYDTKGRKQYKYHDLWTRQRNTNKFHRLLSFGEKLPLIRTRIEEDLSNHKLLENKVTALVISLIERTYIRIGNCEYRKLYGSYGISTMKDRHVEIRGDSLRFSFKGKKGISHEIAVRSRRLSRIVRACKEIPGDTLFQYYDPQGHRHPLGSEQVNRYIRETMGGDFSTKDFRTWAGTVNALVSLHKLGPGRTEAEKKRKVLQALDEVSRQLGNTRAVCKKYYVHPEIIRLYEDDTLEEYTKQLDRIEKTDGMTGWTKAERVLMNILKSCDH
jgi:DNA topoisomerase I